MFFTGSQMSSLAYNYHILTWQIKWDLVARLCAIVNSSVNFTIYCCGGQQYRNNFFSTLLNYRVWFRKVFQCESAKEHSKIVKYVKNFNKKIVVFCGTWCHDLIEDVLYCYSKIKLVIFCSTEKFFHPYLLLFSHKI